MPEILDINTLTEFCSSLSYEQSHFLMFCFMLCFLVWRWYFYFQSVIKDDSLSLNGEIKVIWRWSIYAYISGGGTIGYTASRCDMFNWSMTEMVPNLFYR